MSWWKSQHTCLIVEHNLFAKDHRMILGNIHLNNFKGCNDNTKAVGWIIFIVLSKILTARKVIQLINLFGKALSELSVFKVCICHHCLWPFLITDVVMHKICFLVSWIQGKSQIISGEQTVWRILMFWGCWFHERPLILCSQHLLCKLNGNRAQHSLFRNSKLIHRKWR